MNDLAPRVGVANSQATDRDVKRKYGRVSASVWTQLDELMCFIIVTS